jgi:hypothetical protein
MHALSIIMYHEHGEKKILLGLKIRRIYRAIVKGRGEARVT